MENISPVILWFLVIFIGIIAAMILFLLSPRPTPLSIQQQGAVKRQSTCITIVLFAFLLIWFLSWVWGNLYPGISLPLSNEIGSSFWILAGLVGLYIGMSAIRHRVIALRARGSSDYPSGSCAVVEGIGIIVVVLLVGWFCHFGF